ncbi:MAG: hypothetical protein LBJ00_05345 [Planctomycetaceae bacterium]|nr:hypothetical protein [Planctomycetaceae bacterium]
MKRLFKGKIHRPTGYGIKKRNRNHYGLATFMYRRMISANLIIEILQHGYLLRKMLKFNV